MAMGIFQQLDWLTTRVKRLCCAVEQIQQSGAGSYKVYTALLTQSGGDGPAGNCSDDPQPLVIGVTYQISLNDGTGDFTNVGAPNNNIGTYFVATGTTPNNWGTPGDVCLDYNTGAPVVTVLENTIGNIYWNTDPLGTIGVYWITCDNGLFANTVVTFISGGEGFVAGYSGSAYGNSFPLGPGTGIIKQSSSTLILLTTDSTGTLSQGMLTEYPIEIRVYN